MAEIPKEMLRAQTNVILLNVLKTSETIRASLYFYNTKEDVDRFVQACSEITLENCVGLFF